GDMYIVGSTSSPDRMAFNGFQNSLPSQRSAIVLKFDTALSRIWSSYIGGKVNDYAIDVCTDSVSNRILISGDTYSPDFPVSDCAQQDTLIGIENSFIFQMRSDGTRYCATYHGTYHEEDPRITARNCKIIVSSLSLGGNSPITPNAIQDTFGGKADVLISELDLSSCALVPLQNPNYFITQNSAACTD